MFLTRIKYIIFCSLLSASFVHSQNLPLASGGVAGQGVGQATICWNDSHAATNNQAGMLGVDNFSFQVSAYRQFGLIPVLSGGLTKKINDYNAVGLSIKHVGDSDLNNQVVGLSYARKVTKSWDIGIQADLLTFQTSSFGNRYLATVEISSLLQATEKMRVGFHIFNPFGLALTEDRFIPAIIRLGLLYELSDKVMMLAEVEHDWLLGYNFKGGIDYKLIESLRIRAGYTSGGNQIHFGLSYGFGNFAIHGSTSVHPQLGISPGGEISFEN